MEQKKNNSLSQNVSQAVIAELPDVCQKKLLDWERELNKQGCWNIALVAYQLKD